MTLCAVKNPHVIVGSSYPWFLHIPGSASTDSTNLGLNSPAGFTVDENPHVSRPAWFKPKLFKSHLYYEKILISQTSLPQNE